MSQILTVPGLNAHRGPIASSGSLHAAFGARAAEFPDRVAASDETRSITYAELDRLSSRVALGLRDEGIAAGSLVGMCLERSIDLIICLLGILKAGGAYVPLDPAYPRSRIQQIVEDSQPAVIVCSPRTDIARGVRSVRVLDFAALGGDRALPPADGSGKWSVAVPDDALAYVIYTSGSTGTPKGVMIEHRNVRRLFDQTRARFGFDHTDTWSMFHSIGFDFSVWEIWGALLHGGQVAIVPFDVSRSPPAFHGWLARCGVTVLNQTPSAFRGLDETDQASAAPLCLRLIVFGGELLPSQVLEGWVARHGDKAPVLVNMYGITETTVHATFKQLGRAHLGRVGVPIGQPIPDLRLHLLDAERRPVDDGVAGELYIEGPGVARGYLNQPKLTAERFIDLPLGNGARTRAYRTGDVAVRLADGDYMFIGRADEQIKIRGFRVEPAEVEGCLNRDASVSASHVSPHDYGDGDVRLVAYIVPSGKSKDWTVSSTRRLADEVAARLPDYMRPSAYVVLDDLPLTAHGKVDKRRLPLPQTASQSAAMGADQDLPEEERFVLDMWNGDLGLSGIGLEDDFFDHGGTSLALIRSLARIRSHYRTELKLGALAQGVTARGIAELIRASVSDTR